MLDVRYYKDHKTGKLLGDEQLSWLQKKLKASTANFKFIVLGSQAINPANESFQEFPKERAQLFDFLQVNRISGVIFLSGDRHYGDLNVEKREGMYPIYDFTSSPLTSIHRPFLLGENQKSDTYRVKGAFTGRINYGKISLTGKGKNRVCKLALYGRKNNLLWDYDLSLQKLQF